MKAGVPAGLAAVVSAALIAACASVDLSVARAVGTPDYPAVDPAQVELLQSFPERPFERLADIEATASIDPAPDAGEVESKLRAAGAKLGADAVVVLADRVRPVGLSRSGLLFGGEAHVDRAQRVRATAIRYRRGDAAS